MSSPMLFLVSSTVFVSGIHAYLIDQPLGPGILRLTGGCPCRLLCERLRARLWLVVLNFDRAISPSRV